jgi:hypothetical protein
VPALNGESDASKSIRLNDPALIDQEKPLAGEATGIARIEKITLPESGEGSAK